MSAPWDDPDFRRDVANDTTAEQLRYPVDPDPEFDALLRAARRVVAIFPGVNPSYTMSQVGALAGLDVALRPYEED